MRLQRAAEHEGLVARAAFFLALIRRREGQELACRDNFERVVCRAMEEARRAFVPGFLARLERTLVTRHLALCQKDAMGQLAWRAMAEEFGQAAA